MINLTNKQYWLIEQKEFNSNLSADGHDLSAVRHDAVAIITLKEKLFYKDFYEKSFSLSYFLTEQGIKEGSRVGILYSHNYKFWILVNALWFCGAIPTPLNIRLTIDELSVQIETAEINFLIVEDTFKEFSTSVKKSTNSNRIKIISLNEINYGAYINNKLSPFNYQNPALMMFTSGSSGKPKAVVHTFESIFESVKALDSFANLSTKDIWLASLPFYHIGGFMILCRALIAGSTVSIPNSLKYDDIKKSIEIFCPSHISLVSTTLFKLIKENYQPNKNLNRQPSLKYVFLGGGPLDSSLCIEAYQKGWNIVKVYGSTETCSMVTALKSEELKIKADSVGKPLNGVQIKIVDSSTKLDETISISSPCKKGEIAIYSKSLFKEYVPHTTNEKLKDGFYLTKDYGWLDKDGYLYIESRREDIIITGGENVNIKEVEDAIKKIDGIEDAYVFAEENEVWGQSISAAIVTKTKIDSSELKRLLKPLLASFKIPKQFYFISEIPKTELGKINKEKLLKIIKSMGQT